MEMMMMIILMHGGSKYNESKKPLPTPFQSLCYSGLCALDGLYPSDASGQIHIQSQGSFTFLRDLTRRDEKMFGGI